MALRRQAGDRHDAAASPEGPRHSLVLRPLEDAGLSMLMVSDLVRRHQGDTSQGPAGDALVAEADAVADGVDRGLAVFHEFLRGGELPPRDFVPLAGGTETVLAAGQRARSIDGLIWVDVLHGRVAAHGQSGFSERRAGDFVAIGERSWVSTDSSARIRVRSSRQLMAEGAFWKYLLQTANSTMYLVDRAVEHRGHVEERKILDGGEATRLSSEHAERSLRAVLTPTAHPSRSGETADEDPTTAACRLIAEAMGITLVDSAGEPLTATSVPSSALRSAPASVPGRSSSRTSGGVPISARSWGTCTRITPRLR